MRDRRRRGYRTQAAAAADPPESPEHQSRPIRSTKSISAPTSTTISIPGYKSPASEIVEKPSFETFLSSPVTLADHLHSQLALVACPKTSATPPTAIIGNLDENGYLTVDARRRSPAEEGHHARGRARRRCAWCSRSIRPAWARGSARMPAAATGEPQRPGRRGLADRVRPSETGGDCGSSRNSPRLLRRPLEHIQIAMDVIRHLDPRPGLRYSGPGRAAGGAGRLHFQGRRRLPDSDQR